MHWERSECTSVHAELNVYIIFFLLFLTQLSFCINNPDVSAAARTGLDNARSSVKTGRHRATLVTDESRDDKTTITYNV